MVVAQFAFKPGGGQPTLLWLDNVHTVRSTQLLSEHTPDKAAVDPNSEFMQLTRDLGEGSASRSWTTFFPPKMEEINRGGGSSGLLLPGTSLSAESLRSEFFRRRGVNSKLSCEAGTTVGSVGARKQSADGAERFDEQTQNPEWREQEQQAATGGQAGTFPATAARVATACRLLTNGAVPADDNRVLELEEHRRREEGDDYYHNDSGGDDPDHLAGYQQQQRGGRRFTLPTESWARRSAGSRGHYFSGTGEPGAGAGAAAGTEEHADQSPQVRWPRKRSTGTSMRLDGPGRLDLRSAAENQRQRPRTSPPTRSSRRAEGSGPGSAGDPAGAGNSSSHRFTSANG